MKKAKKTHRVAEVRAENEAKISDLGLMAAKFDIDANEMERFIKEALPKDERREFMSLWRDLHQDYLRFGDRARA